MKKIYRYKQKLTIADELLILSCKEEKKRLMAQVAELTDRALAKKFDVSPRTINRIK